MRRIEALSASKRRRGWIEVRLDGALRFVLPRDVVDDLGLEVGDAVDPDALDRRRAVAEREEALRLALRYLSVRPRSRRELERHLSRVELSPPAVRSALERCAHLGYVDDRAFAAAFARDRIRLRPRGIARMVAELRKRGVAGADAEAGVADALDDEGVTERDLLERAADRAGSRLAGLDRDVARRRLHAYLTRRGFPPVEVRQCLEARLPRDETTW